jgi:hypothetical protein
MDLPPNWSAGMQGMMTLLRVMPPEQYGRYLAAKRNNNGNKMPMTHQHGAGEGQ